MSYSLKYHGADKASALMESVHCHQEILALLTWKNLLICGVGSYVHFYTDMKHALHVKKIFDGQKVHFFRRSPDDETLFVVGGPHFAACNLSKTQLEIKQRTRCTDWILDLQQIDDSKIVIVNAHNQAELWQLNPLHLSLRITADEGNCILYSATIFRYHESTYIFAGTVFSEVLVWVADFQRHSKSAQTIQRIRGHKGVIFSIEVQEENDGLITVCSTSDDRSVMVTTGSLKIPDSWTSRPPQYGHTARVWKAFFLENDLFTLGEDSFIFCWNRNGDAMKKLYLHSGAGVRSITNMGKCVMTGGGDGGVFGVPRRIFVEQEIVNVTDFDLSPQSARKIVTFSLQGLACLTDIKLLYKNNSEKVISVEHELFANCTDLKAACNSVLALCTTTGHLILIDTDDETPQPILIEVKESERCDRLFWSGAHLLVQMSTGRMHLYTIQDLNVTAVKSFRMPQIRQKSATCFHRIIDRDGDGIILGDRTGNLMLFRDSVELAVASEQAHSHLGVSDIKYNPKNTVLSIGAGGVMKETLIKGNELIHLRACSLPMESAVKFLHHTKSTIIAGFHGAHLIVWDFDNKLAMVSYNCGGGHRSYDFHINDDSLTFFYIKQRKVFEIKFHLNFGCVIRSGFHSKVINCMQTKNGAIVSGSDDNTIKVSKLNETGLDVYHTFEQHICGVRGIALVEVSEDTYIVVAVGGREQLTLSQVNTRSGECCEILSHISREPKAKRATDSRYMCVDCRALPDGLLRIVVGCSDCTLKIFSYNNGILEMETVLAYTHCLLEIILFESWIVSFATDGKACFWNGDQASTNKSADNEFSLHQSGINCAVIEKWKYDDTNILATGGDDNRLCVTTFDKSCRILSHFYTDQCHSCQINGVILQNDWLLSSSIDQRVALHSIEGTNQVKLTWRADCLLTVADIHGLCLLSSTTENILLCVYGKGIEVVKVTLTDSNQRAVSDR